MSRYAQVPEWWYVVVFGEFPLFTPPCTANWFPAVMFVFGVVKIEVWNTQMPVWAFILALVSLFQDYLNEQR